MKLVRHFLALLLVVSVAMLTGCGSSGSDGGSAAAGTTITTRLLMPTPAGGSVRGSVAPGVKAAFTDTPVTGATVTLKMADGTTYTMRDNGNGEYSATVTGLTGAAGFYIEAHKGDLELQNLFTSMPSDPTSLTTDYVSTAFTQVALAFAKNENALQIANLSDLLTNVSNISIEFDELRREVSDETNVTYTQTRTFFQAGLAEADTTKADTTTTLLDQLASGEVKPTVDNTEISWTEVISQPIDSGTMKPPASAPADDETAIKAAAKTFLDAVAKFYSKTTLTTTEIASLSSVLSEDFVHAGMTKSAMLNQFAQGLSETDNFVLDHFDGDMGLRKVDDNTYVVGPVGTVYEKDRDGNIVSRAEDSFKYGYDLASKTGTFPTTYYSNGLSPDTTFPFLIRKETAGWKIIGNGIKVSELWLNLINRYEAGTQFPGASTSFWLTVEDTAAFEVAGVTFTGTQVPLITLTKNASLADSNRWHYWWNDSYSNNTYTSGYPHQGFPSTTVHKNGDAYTFVVTFKDNTVQTFVHSIANLPSNWTYLNASITAGSTGVTATWSAHPWSDFEQYYINVHNMNSSGDNRILEKEIVNLNTTNFSFNYQLSDTVNMVAGAQVGINIESHNRWGFSSAYWKPITIPAH